MYAIIDYKGSQILLKEGEKTRVPFMKDSKVGSFITFENVLFFDNDKEKKIGNPYLKSISFSGKIDSKLFILHRSTSLFLIP